MAKNVAINSANKDALAFVSLGPRDPRFWLSGPRLIAAAGLRTVRALAMAQLQKGQKEGKVCAH